MPKASTVVELAALGAAGLTMWMGIASHSKSLLKASAMGSGAIVASAGWLHAASRPLTHVPAKAEKPKISG